MTTGEVSEFSRFNTYVSDLKNNQDRPRYRQKKRAWDIIKIRFDKIIAEITLRISN